MVDSDGVKPPQREDSEESPAKSQTSGEDSLTGILGVVLLGVLALGALSRLSRRFQQTPSSEGWDS